MPLGISTAYGAQALSDSLEGSLRQRITDRLQAEAVARQEAQQQFTNDRLTANDARQAEEHAATMQSLNDARTSTQQAAQENEAAKGVSGLSINQSIPAAMAGRIRGTMQAANMADNPPLAQPPVQGMMQPDVIPGQQTGAVWRGTDAQRTKQEDDQKVQDLINSPDTSPAIRGYLRARAVVPKGETLPYQLVTEPNGPTKDRAPVQVGPNGIFTDPTEALGKPAYHAPQQPVVVQMPTGPGLLNRGSGVATPITDASGNAVGTKESPMIARQKQQATWASADIEDALKQVDAAEKSGVLGPSAGRLYGQFLAGTVGSTGDPAIDTQLGGLKSAISTLNQSYPSAITGSTRGAGAVDRLKGTLNSDRFSASMMRGALNEMKGAVGRRSGDQSGSDAGGGLPSVGGTFNGGKVLKVEKVEQ